MISRINPVSSDPPLEESTWTLKWECTKWFYCRIHHVPLQLHRINKDSIYSFTWHMFIVKQKQKSEHWFHKRSNSNLIFRASLPQMNSPFLLKHFLGSRGHRWGHILSFLIRPEGLAADVGAERSGFSWKEIAKASPFTFFKVSQGFGGGYVSWCWWFSLTGRHQWSDQNTLRSPLYLNHVMKLPYAQVHIRAFYV